MTTTDITQRDAAIDIRRVIGRTAPRISAETYQLPIRNQIEALAKHFPRQVIYQASQELQEVVNYLITQGQTGGSLLSQFKAMFESMQMQHARLTLTNTWRSTSPLFNFLEEEQARAVAIYYMAVEDGLNSLCDRYL